MQARRMNGVLKAGMALVLMSCASLHAFAADAAALGTTAEPPSSYPLSEVEISLRRTGCFGTCPVYEVTIHGDGRVVYKGERFVAVEGEQEGNVEQEQVVALLQELYRNYFFDLRDSYRSQPVLVVKDGEVIVDGAGITDLPSRILRVRIGDYEKTVTNYFGGPPGLDALFRRVDEVAGTGRWVGSEPQ